MRCKDLSLSNCKKGVRAQRPKGEQKQETLHWSVVRVAFFLSRLLSFLFHVRIARPTHTQPGDVKPGVAAGPSPVVDPPLGKQKRAEVAAFMWGREPRGARRGQTGPKGGQKPKRALRRAAPGAVDTKHGRKTQPLRTGCWSPLLPGAGPPCGAGPLNAPAGGSDGNGPLSPSHSLAGVVALCRSARRRAIVPWLAWRSVEACAAVLLCSGWRGGALQKRTPPCCCALAGVVAAQQSRAPPGEGGLFYPPEGGVAGPDLRSRRPWGRPKGANFWACLRRHREARCPRATSMVASVGPSPGGPNPLNYLFHGEMNLVIGRGPLPW